MTLKRFFGFFAVVILSTGCGGTSEVKKEPVKKTVTSKTDELKQKARLAEAASLIGYDGKAIKQNLNKIIDESEKANSRLKELNDL